MYICLYIDHKFFIHSSVANSGLVSDLDYCNSSAMNIRAHVSFQVSNFVVLGQMPRNGTTMQQLYILNFCEVFILYSIAVEPYYIPTNCEKVFLYHNISTSTVGFFGRVEGGSTFLIYVILTGVRKYFLGFVFISVSIIIDDHELTFIQQFGICISLEKYFISLYCHF